MITAASATANGHARIIQNWKDDLRTHPTLDIDFLGLNAPRRIHNFVVPTASNTKFTLPVFWNIDPDCRRSEMSHMA
jgi:hypothetical protein